VCLSVRTQIIVEITMAASLEANWKSYDMRRNLKNLVGCSYCEEMTVLVGRYEVFPEDEKDPRPQISSNFVFLDGSSKISISQDGKVEIFAENEEKLSELNLITEISLRRASKWNKFYLRKIDEIDLQTGQKVQPKFYMTTWSYSFTIEKDEFENTVRELRTASLESLLFLMRSTDLLGKYSELSAISALLALELELSKVVPEIDNKFQEISAKLAVLEYLQVLSEEQLKKLGNLNRLRNALAHGDWQGEKIRNILNDLLKGDPSAWATPFGRMNHEASARVVEETIRSLELLSACRTRVNEALKELRKKWTNNPI